MAGRFSKEARAILPGAYFNWYVSDSVELPAPLGGTVCVPGPHDWGPENVAVLVTSFREFELIYGKSPSDLRRAVFGAFFGRGLPGKGGAAAVLVYRQAGASAEAATIVLDNTADPAVTGLTLTARYKGTAGNAIKARIQPSQASGYDELAILNGTTVVEEFAYPEADIEALASQINASSGLFSAVADEPAVALAPVASKSATGGADGAAATTGDWADMLGALEYEPFGLFAPANVTDPTVHALVTAWVKDTRLRGKRMTAVLGGPVAESFANHGIRTATYNDEDIVSFGTGSIFDTSMDPAGVTAETISTAQGAARVAGDIAARGNRLDLVNSRFAGWMVSGGVTLAQAEQAATTGRTVLTRDGHPDAPCRINLGVTSYTGNTELKPFAIYSVVKFMRTQQLFELEVTQAQEFGDFIGEMGVTDKSVDLVIGDITTRLKRLEEIGVIQTGWTIEQDLEPPPTPQDDFVQVKYSMIFVRGLRAIYNSVTVS